MMKAMHVLFLVTVLGFILSGVTSCDTQDKDVSVKADLATKARAELDFAGVRFTVHHGVVTLNGECATQKAKDKVFSTVKNLYGVKGVINNIRVAEVVIGTDLPLKQAVDSVLKNYAGVEAITKDSIVLLTGTLENSEIPILTAQLSSLKPKKLKQQLTGY